MKKKIVIIIALSLCIAVYGILLPGNNTFHHEFAEKKLLNGFGMSAAYAYPPGVGILSTSTNCLSCHNSNGPWKDDEDSFIDILDKTTLKSLRQPDGSFLIEAGRYEIKTVLTVIGRKKNKNKAAPIRNAWLYIDSTTIGNHSLSKFAPGWDVNLPMSCRVVGDQLQGYENFDITSLPMSVQPLNHAGNATLQLQVMMTAGESIKGNAKLGMMGNYFQRKVLLKVK